MRAKKIKVKTISRFKDSKENKVREIGEIFEVTKTRLKEINDGLPGFIEVQDEEQE